MEKENSINTISILGFVFAFIFFPAGLILSIIGLAKSRKLKKEEGVNPKYFGFSIAGLIISIISTLIAIATVIFVVAIFGFVSSFDEDVLGSYTCNYKQTSVPVVSAEFKKGKFKWAKYNDTKNYVSGSYIVTNRELTNGVYKFRLKLKPSKYQTSSKISTKDYYYITIKKDDSNTTITFDNSTSYNCHRVGNNYDF